MGYNMEWQMLNSKDFGVPQNRERVFIANISEFQLSQGFASKVLCRHNLVRSIGYLKSISNALGYDFDECFELAYQEIKDRKGRWIDGSFVKEEDLG